MSIISTVNLNQSKHSRMMMMMMSLYSMSSLSQSRFLSESDHTLNPDTTIILSSLSDVFIKHMCLHNRIMTLDKCFMLVKTKRIGQNWHWRKCEAKSHVHFDWQDDITHKNSQPLAGETLKTPSNRGSVTFNQWLLFLRSSIC